MTSELSADGPLSVAELAALKQAAQDAAFGDAEGEERAALLGAIGTLTDFHGVDTSQLDATCPECGAHTESITDMFRGPASAVDNFEEARDRLPLEEREVVKHPNGGTMTVEAARHIVEDNDDEEWADVEENCEITTEEYVVSPEDDEHDVGLPATERWCTECDWSERLL